MINSKIVSTEKILRFAGTCIVVSSIAAGAFLLFRHSGSVRGPAGGLGIMSSLIGSSVAGWFAIRARDRRLITAAFVSALPLAFWVWVIYDVVHVNAP